MREVFLRCFLPLNLPGMVALSLRMFWFRVDFGFFDGFLGCLKPFMGLSMRFRMLYKYFGLQIRFISKTKSSTLLFRQPIWLEYREKQVMRCHFYFFYKESWDG